MILGLSRSRSTGLFVGSVAALAWSLHTALAPSAGHGAGLFGSALVVAATWGLVAASMWSCLATGALVFEAFSGRSPGAPRWCLPPAALRRLVVLSSGAALSVGLAAPTMAAAPPAPSAGSPTGVEGLVLPTRTVDTGAPAADVHVVAPGDSLWRIAQAAQPDADEATLADAVGHLHHLNRDLIGSDPDVLRPGQHLQVPGVQR